MHFGYSVIPLFFFKKATYKLHSNSQLSILAETCGGSCFLKIPGIALQCYGKYRNIQRYYSVEAEIEGDTMHKFLRSIGFSALQNDREAEFYLDRAIHEKYRTAFISDNSGRVIEQYQLPVASSMGITVVGHRDGGEFVRDYYFPYMPSYEGMNTEEAGIERHTEKETYAGVMEDFSSGITLIFYLCNSLEARQLKRMGVPLKPKQAFLTGMAVEGKIILPIEKQNEDEDVFQNKKREQKKLFDAAKAGDEDAIEILTETDINLMSEINRRIEEEDLYSLVESSFMPTGIECDQYSILGEIISLRMKSNVYTHENVLDLKLQCNDAIFHVCMNEKDLLGVPAIGRRFKGTIWMQGEMEFLDDHQ